MATESSATDSSTGSAATVADGQIPAPVTGPGPGPSSPARASGRNGSSPAVPGPAGPRRRAGGTVWVLLATLLFAAYSLVFLLVTPTFYGPDEVFQFDRVMAASHGEVIVTPGEFRLSVGASGLQNAFIRPGEYQVSTTFGDRAATVRSSRPSYRSAGGDARPASAVTNYMSQHPPLYYALLGGLTWLTPGSDTMHGDSLVMLVRAFNILLMLSLPLLFYRTARHFAGDGLLARTAAFVPLLVPGLARSASTVNNDNLTIPLCLALLLFSVAVMRGDRTLRTACWIAATCLAASLTKGTALVVLGVVPLAYLVQLVRLRRWPRPSVLVVLVVGAAASAVWWVRNLVEYGKAQPGGSAGAQLVSSLGPARAPGAPIDMANFWEKVYTLVPSRFWGALGVLEPPRLPTVMIWVLCVAVVIAVGTALAALPGRRLELTLLSVLPFGLLAGVLDQSYTHYRTYLSIPGLQGRYLYPTSFGLLFPIAVLAVLVLGRGLRWAPLLVTACSLVVWGWAVYTMVDTLWLPTDVSLIPATWRPAVRQIVAFAPLPGVVTVALAVLAAGVIVGGTVCTVLMCRAYRPLPLRQELGDRHSGPVLPAEPPVPALT